MMENIPNLKEAIELAKIRMKSKKEYERLMGNLFKVCTDSIVFERELDMTLKEFENWIEQNRVGKGFYIPSENSGVKNGLIFINTKHVLDFSIMKMEEK